MILDKYSSFLKVFGLQVLIPTANVGGETDMQADVMLVAEAFWKLMAKDSTRIQFFRQVVGQPLAVHWKMDFYCLRWYKLQ